MLVLLIFGLILYRRIQRYLEYRVMRNLDSATLLCCDIKFYVTKTLTFLFSIASWRNLRPRSARTPVSQYTAITDLLQWLCCVKQENYISYRDFVKPTNVFYKLRFCVGILLAAGLPTWSDERPNFPPECALTKRISLHDYRTTTQNC